MGVVSWVSAPDEFNLLGAMPLRDGVTNTTSGCAGFRGYNDIAVGTSVTVYDQKGSLVASGQLTHSSVRDDGACVFAFTPAVPGDHAFYQV